MWRKRPAESLVWTLEQYVETTDSDSMTSKVHSPAPPNARSILYVADTDDAAKEGATAIERVPTGPDRTVHTTTALEGLREQVTDADCVVFDGDPVGDGLSAVLEACGETPVVVFADGPYDSATGVGVADGYVRRDTDDATIHLVDEINRLCEHRLATAGDATDGEDIVDTETAGAVFETTADLVSYRDRDELFSRLVADAADVLEFDYCWLATINFGELRPRAAAPAVPESALESTSLDEPLSVAFRAREPIQIADLATYEWIDPPFAGVRSLCSIPVGEVGVLYAAAKTPDAFDAGDLAVLESLCALGSAILERNWTERGIENQRNRLEREREQFAERYTRLRDERNALFTLFRNVSEPTLRYDIDAGNPIVSSVNATFEAVFGVDREELVGDSIEEWAIAAGLTEQATTLVDAIRSNERRQLECQRATPDGIRDFILTVVPAAVIDGTPTSGGLIVYEDITDEKRYERELIATNRRFETIVDRIDEDVRTPLNTARGYLELAEKTGEQEHFDVVNGAHKELSDRLQGLVEIATADAADTEPVALDAAVTRAWIGNTTGDAQLVTDGDIVIDANRAEFAKLLEHVLYAAIEIEGGLEADADPVTVTVGTTDDGFYVVGRRPAASRSSRSTDPTEIANGDDNEFELEIVERIANNHGWDVGVAVDDDGTAIAVRGVEILEHESGLPR